MGYSAMARGRTGGGVRGPWWWHDGSPPTARWILGGGVVDPPGAACRISGGGAQDPRRRRVVLTGGEQLPCGVVRNRSPGRGSCRRWVPKGVSGSEVYI